MSAFYYAERFALLRRFLLVAIAKVDIRRQSNSKGCEAGHLGGFEDAENQIGVVAAQVFQKEAGCAVEHDIEGKCLSFGVRKCPVEKQKPENNKIELSFPDFCRPQGLCAVGAVGKRRFGIENAEAAAGRSAESVAVKKVRAASQPLTEDDGRRADVHHGENVDFVPPAIENAGCYAEDNAALDSHAALPNIEKLSQMVLVIIPVKEKNVPQPCS